MHFMKDRLPETADAYAALRGTIFKDGALDVRTKELIAVVSTVLLRCEKCMEIHAQRAMDNGATQDEIAEAISVAMFIAAGSQLHWTGAYDKMFAKKDKEE